MKWIFTYNNVRSNISCALDIMRHTMDFSSWEQCWCHSAKTEITSSGLQFVVAHHRSKVQSVHALALLTRWAYFQSGTFSKSEEVSSIVIFKSFSNPIRAYSIFDFIRCCKSFFVPKETVRNFIGRYINQIHHGTAPYSIADIISECSWCEYLPPEYVVAIGHSS